MEEYEQRKRVVLVSLGWLPGRGPHDGARQAGDQAELVG